MSQRLEYRDGKEAVEFPPNQGEESAQARLRPLGVNRLVDEDEDQVEARAEVFQSGQEVPRFVERVRLRQIAGEIVPRRDVLAQRGRIPDDSDRVVRRRGRVEPGREGNGSMRLQEG